MLFCNLQGKSVIRYTVSGRESGALRKHEIDKQQSVCSLDQVRWQKSGHTPKTRMLTQQKSNHWKWHDKGNKHQLNISLSRREDSDKFHLLPQKAASEAAHYEATLSMQDQICKAETLWAMKTAKEDFAFWDSDGVPQLFQRMFADSVVA